MWEVVWTQLFQMCPLLGLYVEYRIYACAPDVAPEFWSNVMDGERLELTLTFKCGTSCCHSHATACDIRALYIQSRQSLPACCGLHTCAWCARTIFTFIWMSTREWTCMCVCVWSPQLDAAPTCQPFNPPSEHGSQRELVNVGLLIPTADSSVEFTVSSTLHCCRLMLKMLLWAIQHHQREENGEQISVAVDF